MTGVLIYHNILWSHYKGRVFSELFKLCQEQRISLFVVHFAVTERQRARLGQADRALHQYPYRVISEGSFEDLSAWDRIRLSLKELARINPEVVVLPGYDDLSNWVLLVAARLKRRKVILSFDSTELDKPRRWIKELPKRMFVACCDGGFTYGHRSRRYLHKLGMPNPRIMLRCQAAPNEEIREIFDAARLNRLDIIEEFELQRRNFIYVGRLSREKNVDFLIRTYSMLSRTSPRADSWGLLIVGDGPDRDHLMEVCRSERMDGVRFCGGVSWREIPRLLAACDILILPSMSEPWGLVVNEAMACGLPVLVSDACGCVEDLIVAGTTGFTFDPTNSCELRQRMEYFVNDPAELHRIGALATLHMQQYSPSMAARHMLRGIQQLARQSDPSASDHVASRV